MTTTPKGQIPREGRVTFSDASLSVWEEGIPREWDAKVKWESRFKSDVFARIVQCMRRLGWTCTMPEINQHSAKYYGGRVARQSAEAKRFCTKGDLKADLSISGRCIDLKMFQSVNCPTRADHEGRYEHDKEAAMPYVLRLEMERTRRRIRDYLCNVFSGYVFDSKPSLHRAKPLQFTASEKIAIHYAESCHFKGVDWAGYVERNHGMTYNRKSGDGVMLDHGQRVWFFDGKGRACEGTALHHINNMWWVITGRYDYRNLACYELFVRPPENLRKKRNVRQRRKRLEGLLADAAKAMNFERAAVLRDILFADNEPLFVVWHDEHKSYHRAGFCGYAKDLADAGKFKRSEVVGWDIKPNEVRHANGEPLTF